MRRNSDERLRGLERAMRAAPEDRSAEAAWLIELVRSGQASAAQRLRLEKLARRRGENVTFERFVSYDEMYALVAQRVRDRDGRESRPSMNTECWRFAHQSGEWEKDLLETFEQENETKLTKKQREAALKVIEDRLSDACRSATQTDLLRVAEDAVRLVNSAAEYGMPDGQPEAAVDVRAGVGPENAPGVWFTLNRNFRRACQASRHNCPVMRRVTGADVIHVASGWSYLSDGRRLAFRRHTEDAMQHFKYREFDEDLMAAVREVGSLRPRAIRRVTRRNSDWQNFQAWIPVRVRVILDQSPDELRTLRERALYYHWLSIRQTSGADQTRLFDENLPDWDWLRPNPPMFNPRRRNADDELRRLERAAIQGDPSADERLQHARRRAGVEIVTQHSRRLEMRQARSQEETAFLLNAIEEMAWSRIENWEQDRVPINALGEPRVQLAFVVHLFDRGWRSLDDLYINEDLDLDPPLATPLSRAEAIALLDTLVPCSERRILLAGAWARLDQGARLHFRDIFSDDLIRELDNGIECVSQNPRRLR